MNAGITTQKYVVDVYSDQSKTNSEPWRRLGEFYEPHLAINACREVVDEFLENPKLKGLCTQSLIRHFLNYGDVPCINGCRNVGVFDVYEYLDIRCAQFNSQIPGLL
jgi:hypothetical protein